MNTTINDLLAAGVHFGHQTRRWNPKMKPFIFTARNGIYIIDLRKTLACLEAACKKANRVARDGLPVLFVGTKKQAKVIIVEEAARSEQFHVTERWLGGMLTNFQTIRQSIQRLRDLEAMKEDGTHEKLKKKERLRMDRQIEKLNKVLGGIREMGRLPGLVFVVDVRREHIAVAEAHKLGIPVVAMIDTNSDPDKVDFPIAGNDDAIKSISVITKELTDAVIEGRGAYMKSLALKAESEEEGAVQSQAEKDAAIAVRIDDEPDGRG